MMFKKSRRQKLEMKIREKMSEASPLLNMKLNNQNKKY